MSYRYLCPGLHGIMCIFSHSDSIIQMSRLLCLVKARTTACHRRYGIEQKLGSKYCGCLWILVLVGESRDLAKYGHETVFIQLIYDRIMEPSR